MPLCTRRWHRVGSLTALLTLITFVAAPASRAGETTAGSGALVSFDARGVASVGSFCFLAPQAFYPIKVCGGNLESTAVATSDPRGFALAGLAPVPVLSSVGLLVPKYDPIFGTPVPQDVQDAFKSFDFSATPSQCQAAYPPVREGDDEKFCGGPTAGDEALGFTASGLNGHVRTHGSLDDRFLTTTEAVSRVSDAQIPNLQATLYGAHAFSKTGLNADRRPQAYSESVVGDLALFGNLVRLHQIRSVTAVVGDGTPAGTTALTSFGVASASVAGVPVVIGPQGVTVARQAVGDPALVPRLSEQVNEALADAGGLTLQLVPAPPVRNEGGTVAAESGAVEIRYRTQAPTEVEVLYRIGYTSAVVNGVSAVAADLQGVVGDGGAPLETTSAETSSPETGIASPPTALADGLPGKPALETSARDFDFAQNRPDTLGRRSLPAVGMTENATSSDAAEMDSALAPEVAAASTRTIGQPELVRPVELAAATLSGRKIRSLYPAYLALVVVVAALVRGRRLFLPRAGSSGAKP